MVMFNDRPEVREVMRYLTTAESVRYLVGGLGIISPHRDAPFEWYTSPAQLKVAQILFDADTYRFDASDSMPAEVGTWRFCQGIVDWVQGKNLDSILRGIDDSWPGKE
jgi:alpha-glucoside transport system substrate-binding protein